MATQEVQWLALPYDVKKQDGNTFINVAIMAVPRLQDVTTEYNKLSEYPDFVNWPATLEGIAIDLNIDGKVIPSGDMEIVNEKPDPEAWKAIFKPTTKVMPYEYQPMVDYKIISYPVQKVLSSVHSVYGQIAKAYGNTLPIAEMTSSTQGFNPSSVNSQNYDQNSFVGGANMSKMLQIVASILPDEKATSMAKRMTREWEEEGQAQAQEAMRGEQQEQVRKRGPGVVKVPETAEALMHPLTGHDSIGSQFQSVELYHEARNMAADVKDGKKVRRRVARPKSTLPKFDFHQVVSVMREYPVMMRKLGIVRHVQFRLPAGVGANGTIFCMVKWPAPKLPTKNITPKVAYRLTTSGDPEYWQFLPRPESGSEIVGPVLCLNDKTNFDVIQIDVDTVAVKTLHFARHMRHRVRKTGYTRDQKTDAGPPTVRGTGLQLVRVNRGLKLAKALIRNAKNYNRMVSNQEVVLYADDVLRGYRLDVFDATASQWQSLMRRNSLLKFPEASGDLRTTGLTVTDEEGVMTFTATRPVGRRASMRDLYAHETVAQWEGWSLVAPRIGAFIGVEDELQPEQKTQTPPAAFEYKVESTFSIVPKSLPRLRYGRDYRLRARFVDLAGNGPLLTELNPTDFTCASELVRYLRWDPIVSPTITLRTDPVEGESMERMVIRTYNESDDETVLPPIETVNERHFFPPLTAVETAERHSMLDTGPTTAMKGDSSTYNLVVSKTGKPGAPSDVPYQWYKRNNAGGMDKFGSLNSMPSAADQATAIRYAIVGGASTEVPYLPDPMARGIALQNVPGTNANQLLQIDLNGMTEATIASSTGGVVTIAFEELNQWPAMRSILLRLDEGNGKPTWDAGSKTLTVKLDKSEQAWIRFSSSLGADSNEAENQAKFLGHVRTLKDNGITGDQFIAAVRGLSWLLTPGRTLHLVHATQKPLKKPEVKAASVFKRFFDGTDAGINYSNVQVHAKSTQKVDIMSKWDMWVDNPRKGPPVLDPQSSYVTEKHAEDRLKDKLEFTHVQEFGDTKYRKVTYVPTATTRFREYLPPTRKDVNTKITREGIGKELRILSTKRPDALDLVYVIPSFKWVETEKKLVDGVITSTRKGGGLRVYMKRPWFSSGNEELLGVILYSSEKFKPSNGSSDNNNEGDGGAGKFIFKDLKLQTAQLGMASQFLGGGQINIPEELQPYVTQWGLDPIWLSAPTPSDSTPRIGNFIDPKAVLNSVSLAETGPLQRYIVVGFEPQYNEERDLWYCDIEIDPGASYFPFIRLALCRFQPNSLANSNTGADVYCGRVQMSEFCQIAPDRQATARIEEDGKGVTIQVVGHTYRMNSNGQQGSEIEVTVEKRDSAKGDADLGWVPVKTQRIDRIHGANMWAGYIEIPSGVTSSAHRLVIKEQEQFFSDPLKNREDSLGPRTGSFAGPMDFTLDKRIVYADVLNLFETSNEQ